MVDLDEKLVTNYKKTETDAAGPGSMYLFWKRTFDIVCSSLAIAALSPLFLIIAALIKFDSRGPVFYGHVRVGMHGRLFKCWKFRTMVQNSEEAFDNFTQGQKIEFAENFKLKDDPRVTKVGKLLRYTSLDELPQLWNILTGNMTMVGPRPVVAAELEMYGDYREILLSVKPGLTGMWQVNGRSDTTYEERIALDMKYIKERNISLDLRIILKTFGKVFRKEGAY